METKEKKKNSNIEMFAIFLIGIVAGILLMFFAVGGNQTEFFTEYTIATNYIDSVIQTHKIAEINFNFLLEYVDSEDSYYYEDASTYLDNTISELNKAQEELIISKKRLENIKSFAPNDFYKEEIELRIKQINLLYSMGEKRLKMIDLSNKELYEINFGSEIKAEEYYLEANKVIEEFNKDLDTSIEINNEIDIHWGENFYPN